jgi:DNA-binding HxlR family transcriptional regulator
MEVKLLAKDWTVAVIGELAAGPRRPKHLLESLHGLSAPRLDRRLKALCEAGIIERERLPRRWPSQVIYRLTECGEALAACLVELASWEGLWAHPAGPGRPGRIPGVRAARLIADPQMLAMLRGLADGPLRPLEIQRLMGISHDNLMRRRASLVLMGIVSHQPLELPGSEHGESYQLTDGARRMGRPVTHLARWVCEHRSQPDHAAYAGELTDLVLRLIAPLARVSAELDGCLHLHIDSPCGHEPDMHFVLHAGRITARAAPGPVDASCHATPKVLCDALWLGDPEAIPASGNQALLHAALAEFSATLGPPPTPPTPRGG